MATTTNYSWTTPDDTALVKDGAAAIRTLGSSIDTTTKALNPSTTLGDIEYRSSTANTNTRLGIGTTGQVLTVAGGVPVWAASAGGTKSYTQVATGTLSGSALSLTGLSGYDNYVFMAYGMSCDVSDTTANLILNNDTANYRTVGFTTQPAAQNVTSSIVALGIGNVALNGAIYARIEGCLSTTGFKNYQHTSYKSSVTTVGIAAGGIYASTSAITRIDLNLNANSFDAGSYILYGSN